MRESHKVIIYYIKILGSSKIISPYGKKQLQRYTASPFPSCVVNSLILFLSTGMRSRCIKYLKWDRRRLFIKSHFFFLCMFFVLLVSCLDLRLVEFLSLPCFDNNNTVTHKPKRICKKRPFHSFWSNFNIPLNSLLRMKNPLTMHKLINID